MNMYDDDLAALFRRYSDLAARANTAAQRVVWPQLKETLLESANIWQRLAHAAELEQRRRPAISADEDIEGPTRL